MLNEMKYVYAVYQERSFSKAAKKLYISQPALSNMVRKAEKKIGAAIFDRSTIPLTVTKEGAHYIKAIEEIMFIQRNMKAYFDDLELLNTGTLSLGGSSYFCSFVFPELIGKFKKRYPNITIDLQEGNVKELEEGLQDESLDLVIETALNNSDKTLERFLLKKEKIILAVPASFPINKKLQPYRLNNQDIISGQFKKASVPAVALAEFSKTPFIAMKPGNDMYQRGMAMCRNAGFKMDVSMFVDQVLTYVNIASNGLGAVFVRSDIVECLPENNKLVYYKLGDSLAERNVSFYTKKNRYITAAMKEFMRMAGVKQVKNIDELTD